MQPIAAFLQSNAFDLLRKHTIKGSLKALFAQVVMQYAGAQVIWCQEEPKNMGAWRYVKPRMDTAMRELMESQQGSAEPLRIRYVGRSAAASPGPVYI